MQQLANLFSRSWGISAGLAVISIILLVLLIRLSRLFYSREQFFVRQSPAGKLILAINSERILFANSQAQKLLPISFYKHHWVATEVNIIQDLQENLVKQTNLFSGMNWQWTEQPTGIIQYMRLYAHQGKYLGHLVWFIELFENESSVLELKNAHQQLELMHNAFNSFPHSVYFRDFNEKILGCNKVWAHQLGYAPRDVLGKHLAEVLSASQLEYERQYTNEYQQSEPTPARAWVRDIDQRYRLLETNYSPLYDSEHQLIGWLSITVDVTKWHQLNQILEKKNQQWLMSQKELNRQYQLLQTIFNASPDPIGFINHQGIVTGGNNPFAKLLGLSQSELKGTHIENLMDKEKAEVYIQQNKQILASGESVSYEYLSQFHSDVETWYEVNKAPFVDESIGEQGLIIILRDISERKRNEKKLSKSIAQLEKLSFIDALTQVANRRSFNDILQSQWMLHQQANQPLALLIIDIDYFKQYNDYYGHQQGDHVLYSIAQMLKNTTARRNDFVARYGGEEFVVLMPQTGFEGARSLARRIISRVHTAQIAHPDSTVSSYLTLSIGGAYTEQLNHNQALELLSCADRHLYAIKRSTRDDYLVQCLEDDPSMGLPNTDSPDRDGVALA